MSLADVENLALARRISPEALEEETSGSYLVPESAPAEGLAVVSRAEAESVG